MLSRARGPGRAGTTLRDVWMRSENEHYRAVFEASPDATLIVDAEGRILDLNGPAVQMFGWSREELVNAPVERLVPQKSRQLHRAHRRNYAREPRRRPMGAGIELLAVRKDGTAFPVEISLSPWKQDDRPGHVICSVRDITGWQRMRKRSELVMTAAENERKRLSHELHDDVLQCLVSLKIRIKLMGDESDSAKRSRARKQINREILETFEAVKRMVRGLRPPELERRGLVSALLALFRDTREWHAFEVHGELGDVDDEIDAVSSLALYRVVQEALVNAVRHSGEREAWVRVATDDGCVIAEIRDRGCGFELPALESAESADHIGLTGMSERAAMVGGELTIDTAPGGGTAVRFAVPGARFAGTAEGPP